MNCSTQYTEARDASTQTADAQEQQDLGLEVANLANKLLQSSYWFLVLGLTFSSAGVDILAKAARKRETSYLEAARNLLNTLKTPKLTDILKPDWTTEDRPEKAVKMMAKV